MKISFFDDEPEIYPLQYGGKARTITNLARKFIKLPEVEKVTILSKSIFFDKDRFILDGINYVRLNDNNIMENIAIEMRNSDIMNIHCCSFTFPIIEGKAKKFYFLHDVLIATAEKGSHLDKSLGGQFDAVIAPSEFAKTIYEKNKKILGGHTVCHVIPRNINQDIFYKVDMKKGSKDFDRIPQLLKQVLQKYKYILFFPSRPIQEKGGEYLDKISEGLKEKLKSYCIIGPFDDGRKLPNNFINTGWIDSEELKYYYSLSDATLNFSLLPESFSQVCIESVYCETPIVAFDSGNIKNLGEIIDSIIIVEKDINSILKGIERAIDMKKNVRHMEKNKNVIIEKFAEEKVINDYIKLYKKYLEEI